MLTASHRQVCGLLANTVLSSRACPASIRSDLRSCTPGHSVLSSRSPCLQAVPELLWVSWPGKGVTAGSSGPRGAVRGAGQRRRC